MAKPRENNAAFTKKIFIGGRDIESGSITEHVSKVAPIKTTLKNMEVQTANDGWAEDLDKWVLNLERMLEDIPSYMCRQGHPGRISRIPHNLRQVDVKSYEPYFLSIGPYHHGKPSVQPMEMRKKLALKCVLEYKPETTIKEYLNEIMSIETTARSFYTDVQMETEKFVQMLLLDSVFLVAAFCRLEKSSASMSEINIKTKDTEENVNAGGRQMNEEKGTGDDNDNLKTLVSTDDSNEGSGNGECWYWARFVHDIFLIENQIPFFVLTKIHKLVFRSTGTQFIDIMKYEVASMLTYYTKQNLDTVILQNEEIHHLLHLCHMFFRPTIQREPDGCYFSESSQMFRLGNTVQLYEAGIHFEAKSSSTNYSLLDLTFDGSGIMSMPSLLVDDNTESLLRNLIALEQMKYPSLGLNISAYIVLLLHLITIPRDVELLRRKGIIQHHLASDKEMVYLINRLSMGLAFDYVEDEYCLKHVFHELKRYSERRVPRWKAWLKHRHFSNPWTTISLLAASFLLLLTFVQTYYTVYSYYYPYFNGH